MIEMRVLETGLNPQYELCISDKVYEPGKLFSVRTDDSGLQIRIKNDSFDQQFLQYRFVDLPPTLSSLKFSSKFFFLQDPQIYHFVAIERDIEGLFDMKASFGFYSAEWKMPWSFLDYLEQFEIILYEEFPQVGVYPYDPYAHYLSVVVPVKAPTNTLLNEIERFPEILQKAHERTEKKLIESGTISIHMVFEFPDEFKVACEQYLLYFAQFLRDLGVKANTTLTQQAGEVLFTVIPENQTDALDNIRTALEVYLHLPGSQVTSTESEPPAVQRLEANILRLRSDLKLAAAEIRANETTIEAQDLIIDLQKRLLTGDILVSSIKNVTPNPEQKENLLGGLVGLTTFNIKGVDIHLGEVFRKLKKLFEKKSH